MRLWWGFTIELGPRAVGLYGNVIPAIRGSGERIREARDDDGGRYIWKTQCPITPELQFYCFLCIAWCCKFYSLVWLLIPKATRTVGSCQSPTNQPYLSFLEDITGR